MTHVCTQCKFENPEGFNFCGKCGTPLTGVPRANAPITAVPRHAEKRQVTSLFCDLVGSTALSQQLDVEDLRKLIRAYQNTCVPVIERFGGFISGFVGDGILAFFGYPRAHETDAEQAVRSALDIINAVKSLKWTTEQGRVVQLSVRIGIGTGQVVSGDLIGKGSATADEVIGENLNFAARLQSLAEPNTVLIGSRTKRLVGQQFEFKSIGKHILKGFPEPIDVWQVSTSIEKQTRFESMRSTDATPMVNRDDEIKQLLGSWSRTKSGSSQLIVVSGEAGIGKSRVTQAFRDLIKHEAHFYLGYQCSPYQSNTALHPVVAHFQRAARIEHDDSNEIKLRKLQERLQLSGVNENKLLPVFAALLSIPYGPDDTFELLGSRAKKQATMNAFYDQIVGLSRVRPVLAVVEDVHWCDPTSLEVIDRFARDISNERILVVVTRRAEGTESEHDFANAQHIRLSRLDPAYAENLVRGVAGASSLPKSLVDQIVSKADGVALFAEELTKTLLLPESNVKVGSANTTVEYSIPDTLQDSLMARLDQQGIGKRVAQISATIGRQFTYELLESVSGISSVELQSGLAQLLSSGLIMSDGPGPRSTYTFKHALVRDTAYGSLLREERRRFHQRIAEELDSRSMPPPPEVLARHFAEAGLDAQATDYWLLAGQAASHRSAQIEARSHFQSGLTLLRVQPHDAEQQKKLLKYLINYGPILISTEGSGATETESVYQEAVTLTETLPESEDHFTALWGWWRISKNFKTKAERAAKLQELAERLDDDGLKLQAHHCQWATRFHLGDHAGSQQHVVEGIELYDERDHRLHSSRYGSHDPHVCALGETAQTQWLTGFPDKALASMQKARMWAQELQQSGSLAHAMDMNLLLLRYRCAPVVAAQQAAELIAFARENQFPEYIAKAEVFLGWSMAKTGESDEGIKLMTRGIASHNPIGTNEDPPVWLEMLADGYLEIGEYQAGLDTINEAFRRTEASGLLFWQAELHRRRGELLQHQGVEYHEEAWACFEEAFKISHAQGALALELRAVLSMAQCGDGLDRPDIQQRLHDIVVRFSEGTDTPDLAKAHELIKSLTNSFDTPAP